MAAKRRKHSEEQARRRQQDGTSRRGFLRCAGVNIVGNYSSAFTFMSKILVGELEEDRG